MERNMHDCWNPFQHHNVVVCFHTKTFRSVIHIKKLKIIAKIMQIYFEQLLALMNCGNSFTLVFSRVQRSVGEYLLGSNTLKKRTENLKNTHHCFSCDSVKSTHLYVSHEQRMDHVISRNMSIKFYISFVRS